MSLPNYKNYKCYNRYLPIAAIIIVVLLAFYPIFQGKVPLNTRNLVAFFTPWYYEKFPGFPAGVPSKPGMLDQIRLYYPYMKLTQDSYRRGEFPLWNPYNFAGNPHMAEWQSGVFYPLHLLLPFLPLPVYWTIFQLTGFFLAGLFTFAFLRNLGMKRVVSLMGGLTYMLSSFMTTWNMEVVTAPHSILWLPLILLAIDKLAFCHSGPLRRSYSLASPKRYAKASEASRRAGIYINDSKVKLWWLIGLLGIVFSILSGYWQTTLYVMAVAAVYAFYRLVTEKKLSIIHYPLSIISWFILALGLTAFHLLPTWELYSRSSRPVINSSPEMQKVLTSYLLPARHLITLFAPDYFGHPTTRNYFADVGGGTYYEHVLFVGTIPLFLAMIAVVSKNKRSQVLFWALLLVISASFSFNNFWARLIYIYRLPILSTGIANRILFVEAFGLSVLAAIGLEELLNLKREKLRSTVFKTLLIGMISIGLVLAVTINLKIDPKLYIISLRNMVIPTGVFLIGFSVLLLGSLKLKWLLPSAYLLIFVSLSQNLYQHLKFTPFSEGQFIYPTHSTIDWLKKNAGLNRFIGYNGQFLNNNFATYFGIYTVEGYDSLNDYRRSMFIHSVETGQLQKYLPRSADAILAGNLNNPRVLKLLKMFGVRFLVDHPEWLDVGSTFGLARLPSDKEKLVFQDRDWKIWEYTDALPRAFLTGNYEIVDDGQRLIDRFYSDGFDPAKNVLLAQKPDQSFSIVSDDLSNIEITKYTPTKIVFETLSATDQLLVLSDTYYPGWQAKLEDGRRLQILTANFALRAVPVPAGNHTVTMWYFPESFRNGLIISFITVITIIIFIGVNKIKR